jgi:hypothetical protein
MLKAFGTTFLFFLLALPSFGWARCGDLPGDAAALADARAAIEATCSCSGLPTHGAYVACARGVLSQRVGAGLLSQACGATVRQCATRSSCGVPGAVACCIITSAGKTRCAVKRNVTSCRAPAGGSACASARASCCDACANGGCASPTPSPTATPAPSLPFVPCNGGSGEPQCDGACPAGMQCTGLPEGLTSVVCSCVPTGTGTCGAGYPACGGSCLDGRVCQSFTVGSEGPPIAQGCTCVDPATPCGPVVCPAEGTGFCPNHEVCSIFASPGGGECGCLP